MLDFVQVQRWVVQNKPPQCFQLFCCQIRCPVIQIHKFLIVGRWAVLRGGPLNPARGCSPFNFVGRTIPPIGNATNGITSMYKIVLKHFPLLNSYGINFPWTVFSSLNSKFYRMHMLTILINAILMLKKVKIYIFKRPSWPLAIYRGFYCIRCIYLSLRPVSAPKDCKIRAIYMWTTFPWTV